MGYKIYNTAAVSVGGDCRDEGEERIRAVLVQYSKVKFRLSTPGTGKLTSKV